MYHPISEEECRWQCEKCGELNENSYAGAPRRTCAKCGAKRPGNASDWYEIWRIRDEARHGKALKGLLERYFK